MKREEYRLPSTEHKTYDKQYHFSQYHFGISFNVKLYLKRIITTHRIHSTE